MRVTVRTMMMILFIVVLVAAHTHTTGNTEVQGGKAG
jgi:hypothetical protein